MKPSSSLCPAAVVLAVFFFTGIPSHAALSTVHFLDTFASGSGELNGNTDETGTGTWLATNRLDASYVYTTVNGDPAMTRGPGGEGSVPTRQAVLPFQPDLDTSITLVQVEANLIPSYGVNGNNFTGIGFITGFGDDTAEMGSGENMFWRTDGYGTAAVDVLLRETGDWELYADAHGTLLGSGTIGGFNQASYNHFAITYDLVEHTVGLALNGVDQTLTISDLDTIGYVPTITYAGMQIRYFSPGGGVTPGAVDDFTVSSVPEPRAGAVLLALVAAALVLLCRARRDRFRPGGS